uniref:Autophagy protein 5 n=1 Tax=Steinernema glaseri TaxID=37863 RepID=A0A1I8AJ64_9BILA
MDTVPSTFVVSVLRLCGDDLPEELPAAWARRGQAYLKKRGSLTLTCAPSDLQNDALPWTLRYNIPSHQPPSPGEEHAFGDDFRVRVVYRSWFPISPLLEQFHIALGKQIRSRIHFMQGMVPTTLRSINIHPDILEGSLFFQVNRIISNTGKQFSKPETPLSDLPTSFWVDYLLSESSTGINVDMGFDVTSAVIDGWKQMDPRRLPQKIIFGIEMPMNNLGFTEFPMELADARLLETIEKKIRAKKMSIIQNLRKMYIEYIEHPLYPSFRIYAIFLGAGKTLHKKNKRETFVAWTKRDWHYADCTLLID